MSVFTLDQINTFHPDTGTLRNLMVDLMLRSAIVVSPVMVAALIASIFTNFLQIGPLFTFKAISFKIDKLNPFTGITQLFSRNAAVETLKAILKLAVISTIVYLTLKRETIYFQAIGSKSIQNMIAYVANLSFDVGFRVALAMLLLGVFDLFYQRWSYGEKLKMTRQEVKEESKQTEGSPETRRAIQDRQMSSAQRRMMEEIPDADVVITNPIHVAIALRYDRSRDNGPIVIAKGGDFIAKRIREIAEENEIPIVEDKPLAWALFEIEIGEIIPFELYKPVAQILARIYSMKNAS